MVSRKLFILLQFLYRDFYTFSRRIKTYAVNYMLIYPIAFSVAFGYFLPSGSFGNVTPEQTTIIFIGSMLVFLQVTGFVLNLELVRDLEGDKFINYQISILDARLVIIERIVFVSLFSFILVFPYFPISTLILGPRFFIPHVCWPAVYLMLLLGSFLCSALNVWAFSFLNGGSRALPKFWLRIYNPMVVLGGFAVPWIVINTFSKPLSYILLANPLIYISEGLRQSFLHSERFFSLPLCIGALILFSCGLCASTMYYFKKKIDHI